MQVINRRTCLKALSGSIAATGLLSSKSNANQKPAETPNIVFIYIDDLGWRDLGYMGSQYYETPNIDRLAKKGMVFTNAYANAPNCAPSRACLMSGQYSPRHGIFTVASSARGKSKDRKLIPIENNTTLSNDVVTIAERLSQAGYQCGHIGKWHLGDYKNHGPQHQGFHDYYVARRTNPPSRYFSKPEHATSDQEEEYLTDRLTDESIKFIEKNHDNPFFLYLCHHAVHTPIEAKKKLIEKYKKKKTWDGHTNPVYAAMIDSVDQSVGRIIQTLDDLDLSNNTMVIFYSDNGGYGPATSMQPLRGAKGMLYEGGIRVPMICYWPGKIQAGTKCDTPIIGIDFYPTFLELAGLKKRVDKILDGQSIIPLLKQQGHFPERALYWHFPAYLEAYKKGVGPWRTTPAGAIRSGDYKLIEFFEDNKLELYNLKKDISESNDLSNVMPDKTKELHQRLKNWRKSVNAPVPRKLNPEFEEY